MESLEIASTTIVIYLLKSTCLIGSNPIWIFLLLAKPVEKLRTESRTFRAMQAGESARALQLLDSMPATWRRNIAGIEN